MNAIKGAAAELGTERIRKLLVQYAVPAIIAMTASSLYNMIDSIFIGHGVGPMAISGLAVNFPLFNLIMALCMMVAVGGATVCSIELGRKNEERAGQVLGQVVIVNAVVSVAAALALHAFIDPILTLFGASDATRSSKSPSASYTVSWRKSTLPRLRTI